MCVDRLLKAHTFSSQRFQFRRLICFSGGHPVSRPPPFARSPLGALTLRDPEPFRRISVCQLTCFPNVVNSTCSTPRLKVHTAAQQSNKNNKSSVTTRGRLPGTSLKWTSCIPTSSIMAASSSMLGVVTRNDEQPCLNIPDDKRQRFLFL